MASTDVGLIRTDLGRFWDKGNQVFDVRHPDFEGGAKGDGSTDDTRAIQAAINAASAAGGGMVVFPVGVFIVSSDIDIPNLVQLRGSSVKSGVAADPGTTIKWGGASAPTNAVVTANLDGSTGFARSIQLKMLRINANGEAVGLHMAGLNETCTLEDVEVRGATSTQFYIDQATTSERTQNCNFTRLKAGAEEGSIGFRLEEVRFCSFINITVDTADSNPVDVGLALENGCWNNVFLTPHLENCTIPCEIGYNSGSNNVGNLFFAPSINAPEVTPADTTVGSDTGTMGFLIRDNTNRGTVIQSLRDEDSYDWPVYDEEQNILLPTRSTVNRFESRVMENVTSSKTNLSVANRDYVQVSTSGGNVTINGLQNGVKGQRLTIFKRTSANSLIIGHSAGVGTQNIICPSASDITLTSFGGVDLVCDGTNWFVVSE